jgi:hypothetical protein
MFSLIHIIWSYWFFSNIKMIYDILENDFNAQNRFWWLTRLYMDLKSNLSHKYFAYTGKTQFLILWLSAVMCKADFGSWFTK